MRSRAENNKLTTKKEPSQIIWFSLHLARLVPSIYPESSGGSQPAEPAVDLSKINHIYCLTVSVRSRICEVVGLFQDLSERVKEAEESQRSLQAECEQYRTVLAETVSE